MDLWTTIGLILGAVSIAATVAFGLFPEVRHFVLPRFGLSADMFDREAAAKGWYWLNRLRFGNIRITSPRNYEVINPGPNVLTGTHNRPSKGRVWALAVHGRQFWLHNRINLRPDGKWTLPIHVGDGPGPRSTAIIIVWVSDFVDSLIDTIKDRSNKADDHGSFTMLPEPRHFVELDSVILTIGHAPSQSESERPRLEIVFDRRLHVTTHPNGGVDIRVILRNASLGRIRPTAIKIKQLEALSNMEFNSASATQFAGYPLKIVRGELGMALDGGDFVEIGVVHAPKDSDQIYFHGTEGDHFVPAGRYRIVILGAGKGAEPAERAFIIDRNANGELTLESDDGT